MLSRVVQYVIEDSLRIEDIQNNVCMLGLELRCPLCQPSVPVGNISLYGGGVCTVEWKAEIFWSPLQSCVNR